MSEVKYVHHLMTKMEELELAINAQPNVDKVLILERLLNMSIRLGHIAQGLEESGIDIDIVEAKGEEEAFVYIRKAPLSFIKWFEENRDEIYATVYETGATRELDYDEEIEINRLYERYKDNF